jgi:hypothetical protein
MVTNMANKNVAKILMFLSALTFTPLTFLNFDTHHDGLIVQTVINLKEALSVHGEWPFNQYGSFWIFIFTWGTWPLSNSTILIGIRVITIISYWLAGFLLLKIARQFLSETASRLAVVYFFLSQPFFGGWNSSFLPWPSALAIPILLAGIFIVLQRIYFAQKSKQLSLMDLTKLALAGALFAMLYGTRIQIGILGSLTTLIFLQIGLGVKASSSFAVGNILVTLAWSLYLFSNGWLSDSLVDSIQLASTFLSGEHIPYPKPVATAILSIFMAVCVVIVLKLGNSSIRKMVFFSIPVLIPALFLGVRKLRGVQNGKNDVTNYIALIHRKLMAGFLFATLLIVVFVITMRMISALRQRSKFPELKWLYLTFLSIIAAFQAWPFFDQMHIWWGSIPGVILIVHLISKVGNRFNLTIAFANMSALGILLIMLIPLLAQLSQDRKELLSYNQKHVYGFPIYENQNLELTKFFESSIPRGSEVLNLCPNAEPFFVDLAYVQVSRFPVYWMTFSRFPNVQKEFIENNPAYIVTCKNLYYPSDATVEYREMQKSVIEDHALGYQELAHYSRNDFDWEIYGQK